MPRDVLTPVLKSKAVREGGLFSKGFKFRKQILPERDVDYTDREGNKSTLVFDSEYNTGLLKAFRDNISKQALPFVLAKDDNSHSMDPEQFRGKIEDVELARDGEDPGLYATIAFPSKRAAQAVLDNPELGVSVRIKEEDVQLSDGSMASGHLVHVCGTLDPQVKDMKPWERVDLSGYTPESDTIDLTSVTWKGNTMPKSKNAAGDEVDLATATTAPELTDAQLDAILASFAAEIDGELGDDDDDAEDGGDEDADGEDSEGDPSPVELSTRAQRMIDLANSRASEAETRANRALQNAADKDWAAESREYVRAGVPKVIVDLAEPYVHTVDPKVIDLSNGKSMDGSAQMRKILDALKGMNLLDLTRGPQGHNGDVTDEESAEFKSNLDTWEQQYPTK